MSISVGQRLRCARCGTAVIIVKASNDTPYCCGAPMERLTAGATVEHPVGHAGRELNVMANKLGKRYTCQVCGGVVIVTNAGDGALECCGQAMVLMEARVIPTSD